MYKMFEILRNFIQENKAFYAEWAKRTISHEINML